MKVALIFKDFAAWCRSSCVGLHVAGFATAEVLRREGIDVSVFPVRHNVDLVDALVKNGLFTHVVISAPWLSTFDLKAILEYFPTTKFVILSHSNVGFLQADPWGVELLREYLKLSKTHLNLQVGGNSPRFVDFMRIAYGERIRLLPNLYPVPHNVEEKHYSGGLLKIGAFGAIRPYKNFITAAAAALIIRRTLDVPVEFHMSSGADGERTVPAIQQMCRGIDGFELIQHDWSYWNNFIELVSAMDLLLQVSYTESFNMITADGVYVGVPSVVSPAIYWAPDSWKAEPDNAMDIAKTGMILLRHRPFHRNLGLKALRRHNDDSIGYWLDYLNAQ